MNSSIETLRKMLVAVLLLGLVGIWVELFLLEHTEGPWQKIPLVLIGVSLVAFVVHVFIRNAGTVRFLQAVMVFLVLSGLLGTYLHYDGNMEFELEMSPAISGWKLFSESMTGATPALAPGTFVQLGLLGLACTYRHPFLTKNKH